MSNKDNKFWSPNFMSEFKKWMDNHESQDIVKGSRVTTELKLKTLVERIDCISTLDHPVIEVAKYFLKHGGLVKEVNGPEVVVKTKKGTFIIQKEDIREV